MAKKNTSKLSTRSPKQIVLGVAIVAALGALAVMVVVLPKNQGSQPGVGADGYSVFEKKGADIGVVSVSEKSVVVAALGDRAKTVDDVTKSGVISLNGNLGQTATYTFTTPTGTKSYIDIDILKYQSQAAMDSDDLEKGTGSAGKVNNMDVRYLPAKTIGSEREYALLVSKDLKSYKFSMMQPSSKAEIREYKAWDILKAIIAKSDL